MTDQFLQRAARWRGLWATWPNAVTLLRLVLTVPLCLAVLAPDRVTGPVTALVVAATVAWAGSDWVDGALARRLSQRTQLGEVLDPVADRLGLLALGACLAVVGHLPWWPVAVIAVTDVVVTLGVGRLAARGRMRVSRLGKVRTAVLLAGLCLVVAGALLAPALAAGGTWAVGAGAVLHALAGVGYLRAARPGVRAGDPAKG